MIGFCASGCLGEWVKEVEEQEEFAEETGDKFFSYGQLSSRQSSLTA